MDVVLCLHGGASPWRGRLGADQAILGLFDAELREIDKLVYLWQTVDALPEGGIQRATACLHAVPDAHSLRSTACRQAVAHRSESADQLGGTCSRSQRSFMGTKAVSSGPTYTCRGRRILLAGSSCNSFHWAIHPGSRPMAKQTVNMLVGIPIARRITPL